MHRRRLVDEIDRRGIGGHGGGELAVATQGIAEGGLFDLVRVARGERAQRGDAARRVASDALGIGSVNFGDDEPGRSRAAPRSAPRSPARTALRSENVRGEKIGFDQARTDIGGEPGMDQRDPCGILGIERLGQGQERLGGAVAGLGHLVERDFLPGDQPIAERDQSGASGIPFESASFRSAAASASRSIWASTSACAISAARLRWSGPFSPPARIASAETKSPAIRERQRLVKLAIGGERFVAGHRVELRLRGGEIVLADLDPRKRDRRAAD